MEATGRLDKYSQIVSEDRRATSSARHLRIPHVADLDAKLLGMIASPAAVFLNVSRDGHRVFWPAFPPDGFLGQLDDAFQQRMAETMAVVTREDCAFYHTVELPSLASLNVHGPEFP